MCTTKLRSNCNNKYKLRKTKIETYSVWLEGFGKVVVGFTEETVKALKTLN